MTIRILVADDHSVVLEGVRHILDQDGFELVGTAEDGRALVRAAWMLTAWSATTLSRYFYRWRQREGDLDRSMIVGLYADFEASGPEAVEGALHDRPEPQRGRPRRDCDARDTSNRRHLRESRCGAGARSHGAAIRVQHRGSRM